MLATAAAYSPPLWTAAPFAALLLAIAVVPLIHPLERFWRWHRWKLAAGLALALPVLLFYLFGHPGSMGIAPGERVSSGLPMFEHVLHKALIEEYIPFIMLLVALFVISGGIELRGDLVARPAVNTAFLATGAVLASLIGTTGAGMLLIRPLLHTNIERRHTRHTVVFFIFIVCNIGGCLLPIGDPPLFLGYLMGVPFLWTLSLAAEWAIATVLLLAIYYVLDRRAYAREEPEAIRRDLARVRPLSLHGRLNLLYLVLVVLAVAIVAPGKPLPLLGVRAPLFTREALLALLAGLSLLSTPWAIRRAVHFSFSPIIEVAVLFLGIFLTMQAPMEILRVHGPELGLKDPWHFFWATGMLSSFLDNAPTYAVFFETARSFNSGGGHAVALAGGGAINAELLSAVSLGAVFMGANTYIGNGPNFMVKAIAEHRGIRMPSFLGYMGYSAIILLPLFALLTVLFFVLGIR